MKSETPIKNRWQPRFYFACAMSTSMITAVNYFAMEGWWGGLAVGFGLASVLALLFLAIQHWSLAESMEVQHV